MKKAVVIIPTYNERKNIQQVIPKLLEVFSTIKKWQMHILVVDDTSPDKTYEVVDKIAKKEKQVHLLINKQKAGLGGAYLKGMEYAFESLHADVIFQFDADLSHDPEKIPVMLGEIESGTDMVLGSRYISGGGIPADWGMHRKFLSVVGNLVIMLILTRFSIRDWTTGYRALTKEVYTAVHPQLHTERFFGYTFQIGFLYTALKKGFKISEVPFQFIDRTDGESKLGPEYIKNTLMFILKVRLQELLGNRIIKFGLVGGFGAFVQLLSLQVFRYVLPDFTIGPISQFLVATLLSIETAIISNFILNNAWTFADRKLQKAQIVSKFAQFNAASGGSLLIQLLIAFLGERLIGLFALFTVPVIAYTVDTGQLYAVVGILIGMLWNFFAYSFFIWKK